MDPKMVEAINDQINAELYSAYLYGSMVAYFEHMGLKGMAHWMVIQTLEETTHAYKFFAFLCERGERVALKPIDGPPVEFDSPLAVFEAALKHEKYVTGRINDLMNLALELKDHATVSLLHWYVDEQVEEEANATEISSKLRLIGDNSNALLMMDKDLSARVFTAPPGMPAISGPAAG